MRCSQVSCASSWSWHTSACFGTRIQRCWCLQHGRRPLSWGKLGNSALWSRNQSIEGHSNHCDWWKNTGAVQRKSTHPSTIKCSKPFRGFDFLYQPFPWLGFTAGHSTTPLPKPKPNLSFEKFYFDALNLKEIKFGSDPWTEMPLQWLPPTKKTEMLATKQVAATIHHNLDQQNGSKCCGDRWSGRNAGRCWFNRN